MLVMVIGCGRVGSGLARELLRLGHDVIVVEQDLNLLSSIDDLNCVKVHGIPMDREVLQHAGVETCDAVCCVTPNENINIMTAEVCQNLFKVPQVLVRTMNTGNSVSFRQLGLNTINSTRIVVERMLHDLHASSELGRITLMNHQLRFRSMLLPDGAEDKQLAALAEINERHIVAVLRGEELLLTSRLAAEAGDVLVYIEQVPEQVLPEAKS